MRVFVEKNVWRKRYLNWGFGCYGLNGVLETAMVIEITTTLFEQRTGDNNHLVDLFGREDFLVRK